MCLKGDAKGLGPVCPATQPGIGFKNNPRYCVPVIVEKVPCIKENGNLEAAGAVPPGTNAGVRRDEL